MTDATQTPTTAVAVRERTDLLNTQPMLDTQKFEHFQRASKALMNSSILNPTIRGSSPEQCFSNLMLIFDLSDRWKLPAVSIAQGISIVHDKIVYEGKLITAMLQASLGVHLQYWWTGERGTPDYRIYVSDRPFAELAPADATPAEQMNAINTLLRPGVQIPGWRLVDGSVGDWRTYQKDQRTPNPAWTGTASQNQLSYRGAREWARRYESAQMLGVYGDDEMEVLTARVVEGPTRSIPGGLSGGFTKPAEQPIEDAVVEDIKPADDKAPETPAETEKPVEDAKPASGRRKAQAKQEDGRSDGQKRDAADLKAKGEEASKRLEVCEQMADAAREAALWGNRNLEGLLATGKDDEQRNYIRNGFEAGLAEAQREGGEAYDLGFAGTPILEPEWLTDAPDAQTRWGLIKAKWQRGADDGSQELTTGGDQTEGDDSEADDADMTSDDDAGTFDQEEVDATRPVTTLEAFMMRLGSLTSWADLKAGLSETAKSDDWKAAPTEQQDIVRAEVWKRMRVLTESGEAKALDVATDLTAFRCWVALEEDIEAIQGTWQHLVHQPVYTGLKPDQQQSLERATLARVQALTE